MHIVLFDDKGTKLAELESRYYGRNGIRRAHPRACGWLTFGSYMKLVRETFTPSTDVRSKFVRNWNNRREMIIKDMRCVSLFKKVHKQFATQ